MSNLKPRHILVALDASEQAATALRLAAELARCCLAELTLLHVAVPRTRVDLELSVTAAQRAEAAARIEGEWLLEESQAEVAEFVPCSTELVFGDPADLIVERAGALGAELIVLGSRRLSRLDRLLLGSVGTAVVQRAPCSVLVARQRATDLP